MHFQPLADGPRLVLADIAQSVAMQAFREVEVRGVLNDQDPFLVLHPSDGLLAMPSQNPFWTDRFAFTCDEPIIGFELVAVARQAFAVGCRGIVRLGSDNAQKSLFSILMTELNGAKLRFNPALVMHGIFDTHRLDALSLRDQPHFPPPVRIEFTEVDILSGSHRPSRPAPGAPGASPKVQPVGGAIATAKVALAIDKAFHQPGLDPIAVNKITHQPFPT